MSNPLPPPLSDLEARLRLAPGTLEHEDKAAALTALADATALVLAEVPAALADTWKTNAPDVVTVIVLKAARREFENPRGISQEAQGEHSISLTNTSGVYLTQREIQQIRRAARSQPSGFFGSIRTPSAY